MVCFCKLTYPAVSDVDASEWQLAGSNVVEPSSLDVSKANINAKFKVYNADYKDPEFFSAENSGLVVNKALWAAAPAPVCNAWTLAIERGTAPPDEESTSEPKITEQVLKTAKFLAHRLQDVYVFYDECFGWRGRGNRRNRGNLRWPPSGFINWAEEDNAVFDGAGDWGRGCVAFGVPALANVSNHDANLARVLDCVGHECTHAVIQFTTDLDYSKQSGALNESLADCFGIMVKHWKLRQRDPNTADWTFCSGINYPYANGFRNLKNPGAYSQPWHMDGYDELGGEDNYGVHHNSGIPNCAFYYAAVEIGRPTWQTLGEIWFKAMTDTQRVAKNSTFREFAEVTIYHSPAEFESQVRKAWELVGVLPVA
ncbi:hypothetical protein B0T24DRAFT_636110 [Lasiosphaeria ovina]|uniref:Peptidase M4 C-terminal domain-containing protein n=1 Tax=Lasiosphaeria ovina TaxID=92902 RepID=A0AAE0JWD0_9PEZI|nr:hypothetical protein B0T24DRAFT_636110 [Lasiosphaeria ovina]